MQNKNSFRFLLMLAPVMFSLSSYAATTERIMFSGILKDAQGGTISGKQNVRFSIFQKDKKVWNGVYKNLDVKDGIVSVALGDQGQPLKIDCATSPTIQVEIDNETGFEAFMPLGAVATPEGIEKNELLNMSSPSMSLEGVAFESVSGGGDCKCPRGPRGFRGYTGMRGAAGPAGSMGPAGATGPAGAVGAAGATGPAGAMGPVGPMGPSGEMGPVGETGAAGSIGPIGPMGPVGATGATGATGSTGATGATGAQGLPGSAGAQGQQGIPGPQGAPGVDGANGLQGPMGPQGPAGESGMSGHQIVVSSQGDFNSSKRQTETVTCPAGKVVTGGGVKVEHKNPGSQNNDIVAEKVHVNSTYPSANNAWTVILWSADKTKDYVYKAYAVCVSIGAKRL